MFQIIPFIQSYGYIAIFVGSIFEGESIVLLGGFASHEKYLFFPFVFLNGLGALFWAFIVTIAGYIAGDVLESLFGEIKKYEFRIIVFTVVVIAATMIILRITQMILRQKKDE